MKIKIQANAKINLYLDVLNKRDDGFHNINTLMQSVDLCDDLYFRVSKQTKIVCNEKTLENKDNLIFKAIEKYNETAKTNFNLFCKIKKRIPLASGLGGGSANAAAALIAVNYFNNNKLNNFELIKLAAKIGSDVPFFIIGGTVSATGKGEILERKPNIEKSYCVLFKYGNKSSTTDMYSKIDSVDIKTPSASEMQKECFNKFLYVLNNKEDIETVIKSFKALGAYKAGLSGAGPTVFGLFSNKSEAEKAYKAFKKISKNVYFCKTENYALKIVD